MCYNICSMNKNIIRFAAPLASVPFLFGCSSESAGNFTGETTPSDMFATGEVATISPGESMFSGLITDSVLIDEIVEDIEITEHQHPGSWDDDNSPTVGVSPIRVDAHQAFSNESKAGFSNDVACDSLQLTSQG